MYHTLEEITVAWKSGAISGEQFLVLKHEFTSQVSSAALADSGLAPAAPVAKISAASKTMLALGAAGMAAGSLALAAASRHERGHDTDSLATAVATAAPVAAYQFGLAAPSGRRPPADGAPGAHIRLGRPDFAAQRQQKVTGTDGLAKP